MPWQRHVVDVAMEVDTRGRLVYREVVITVPRQSGKTTLGLSVRAHRALVLGGRFGPQSLIYTAQTRNDARMKWEDEHWPILRDSPIGNLVTARKRAGGEAFVWKNGSIDSIPAPTAKAGHGKTLDLGFIDEAFAQTDDRLEQAFRPAMITRSQPQLWVVSTAGTKESTYLRAKVQAGRQRLEQGKRSTTAYFEWSAPNDADVADPATWRACMPALGQTIDERGIQAEFDRSVEEHGAEGVGLFRRAYLNQWTDEFASGWGVISKTAWSMRGGGTRELRPDGPVVFALAAEYPDAEHTTIAVSGRKDGELLVQVVERHEGTSWAVPEVVRLTERYNPVAVVVDPKSPAARMLPDLEAARLPLVTPNFNEVAQGCGIFYDAVMGDHPALRHYNQPVLDDAVAAALKRPYGDVWLWDRKGHVDHAPLEAVTLAAWGMVTRGTPTGPPNIWLI